MKKRKLFCCVFPTLLILSLLSISLGELRASDRQNPFSVEWDDSIQNLKPGDTYELKVKFKVPLGHYLYGGKTGVTLKLPEGFQLLRKEIPAPEKKFDPFLKKEAEVFLKDFEIRQFIKVPKDLPNGRVTLEGEVKYQGCSADFCYRPMTTALLVPLQIGQAADKNVQLLKEPHTDFPLKVSASPPVAGDLPKAKPVGSKKNGLFSLIRDGRVEELLRLSPFLLLLLVFLAGVATDFTPCVLPIIPLTLAVIGIRRERKLGHNAGITLSLVAGMALTYAVLGMASATLGLRLGFLFQSRIFLGFLIAFFLLMSLSMLGVIQLQFPLRVRNFLAHLGGASPQGAFLSGFSIGWIAFPCVGPLIVPLLLYVARAGSPLWGLILLFTYGLGMGSLFFLGGTFYATVGAKLRGGAYTGTIKKALAVFLLLPAIYYGYVLFSHPSAGVASAGWYTSLDQGLKAARQENKPILIDFFAKWCLPCLELDQKTFGSASVKEALKDFVIIKIDCTLQTDPCTEAVNRFGVVGWPTVLFLNKEQELLHDLSVVGGFIGPERMHSILQEVKRRS